MTARPPRFTSVSPMALCIEAIDSVLAVHWPDAGHVHLVDESLYADLGPEVVITPRVERRLDTLLHYAADSGAGGILFTGSVFGDAVMRSRRSIGVPVLHAYEALIEAAFAAGRRIGVVTTSPFPMKTIQADFAAHARAHGIAGYELVTRVNAAARPLTLAGDVAGHDRMVAATARELADVDVLVLGHFSMATAAALIRAEGGRPVLTAPETAVLAMRRRLTGA